MKTERLRRLKAAGEKIAMLTAYDYPTARLLEEAGVDCLLVGDSLGMVVLGYEDTTSVTLEEMLHHTRAVARGVRRTLLVADLSYGTYATPELAVENGLRLLQAGAHAVKLEGGRTHEAHVAALVAAGIPVMGHLGMLPQRVREEGGYRLKGKTPAEAEALLEDARALEAAGAFAMVLELVKPATAERITQAVAVPTIGIGSGRGCDGQVLVTHDLLGAFPWFTPRFVTPRVNVAAAIREAVGGYLEETKGAPLALATPDAP